MTEPDVRRSMTVDEYFQFEESSPLKHEYVAGEVYAMSGVTVRHNTIARNVIGRLLAVAGDGPCQVFFSDVRLQAADDTYYYPDLMVVCGEVSQGDIIVREPCVVVEVTSPSTARIDRGEKLAAYRDITSLRAYLIVDHRRRRVERHWRDDASGKWMREELVGEGSVAVPCLDVNLTLDAIYHRVELTNIAEPDAVDYETY
jgi:Uma2 family endonuclease